MRNHRDDRVSTASIPHAPHPTADLDGPLVFVDVDTQRDFLEPGGALAISGASAILPNLARLTNHARARGIPILATACAHTPDDPDPEPFPAHCLVGTHGQGRVEETDFPGSLTIGPEGRFPSAGVMPHATLEKRQYDLFSHADADSVIGIYAANDPTFVVYGVATDYCVAAAVRGLLKRGHRVAIVVDAIRGVDQRDEGAVLTSLVALGATLTLTRRIVPG